MKTVVKSDFKSKTFCVSKSYALSKGKRICINDSRFYQKLFVVLISLSTFLIFSESPREMENVCEIYNSKKSCLVW